MAKTINVAEVLVNREISAGIYDMMIYSPEIAVCAKPGQFVMIYTNDSSKLLPRPISICEYDLRDETLRFVYRVSGKNTGTEQFSKLRPGEKIRFMGPIGNGYDLESIHSLAIKPDESTEEKTAGFWKLEYDMIAVGGGIGIPPMLGLVKEYHYTYPDSKLAAVLGFRSNDIFLADDFRRYCDVYFASDDGKIGTHGNVIDAIKDNDIISNVICACGPMPMLRGVSAYASEKNVKAYVSLEERMACGIGACLGCVTKTKNKDEHSMVNNTRVCVDGPVFDTEVLDI